MGEPSESPRHRACKTPYPGIPVLLLKAKTSPNKGRCRPAVRLGPVGDFDVPSVLPRDLAKLPLGGPRPTINPVTSAVRDTGIEAFLGLDCSVGLTVLEAVREGVCEGNGGISSPW
jgi:hypothetical protein